MDCPETNCSYNSEELRSLSQHWRMSHEGTLKEEHPELYGLTVECDMGECGRLFESEYAKNYHISHAHTNSIHTCQECGEEFNRPPSNVTGKFTFCSIDCRNENEDWKENIRDTVSQVWQSEDHRKKVVESSKGQEPTKANKRYIKELGHYVDSTWEEIVGLALKNEGIKYENEPEFKRPTGHSYYPDFAVEDTVIEVKGYADSKSIEKAREFLEEYPEYRYVVFGDGMPCDIHISVEGASRKDVLDKVPELVKIFK